MDSNFNSPQNRMNSLRQSLFEEYHETTSRHSPVLRSSTFDSMSHELGTLNPDPISGSYERTADGSVEYAIKVDVQDLEPKDISVTLNGRILTIEGKRVDSLDQPGSFNRKEFRRQIQVPNNVDEKVMRSTYDSAGQLIVRAPVITPSYGDTVDARQAAPPAIPLVINNSNRNSAQLRSASPLLTTPLEQQTGSRSPRSFRKAATLWPSDDYSPPPLSSNIGRRSPMLHRPVFDELHIIGKQPTWTTESVQRPSSPFRRCESGSYVLEKEFDPRIRPDEMKVVVRNGVVHLSASHVEGTSQGDQLPPLSISFNFEQTLPTNVDSSKLVAKFVQGKVIIEAPYLVPNTEVVILPVCHE